MKNILGLGAAALAVPAAAAAVLIHPAVAVSDPVSVSSLSVVGEPYGKAVQILKSQGAPYAFGGAVGSDVPQAQCIVSKQTAMSGSGKFRLMLDCTREAVEAVSGPLPKGTIPGANGVNTITLTPSPRALNAPPPPLNP